jgi:DNA-binding transcriptional LysR family regulator
MAVARWLSGPATRRGPSCGAWSTAVRDRLVPRNVAAHLRVPGVGEGRSRSPPCRARAGWSLVRGAGFSPKVRQEVPETSSLVALVAAGLGVALAPSSVRHLRINGVTHRPLADSINATIPLAAAYKAGPVSPVVRGYLETARSVTAQPAGPVARPAFR